MPDLLKVSGTGIVINYDPNYKAEDNGGLRQEILVVQTASIVFPKFDIAGEIRPSGTNPGLVVYEDGFKLGEAELSYGKSSTGAAIKLGSILEFDDIRIGVTDFELTFGSAFKFTGTMYIATGGAKFLPGKPISASITDRTSGELASDTEAMRVAIDFGDDGKVKGFLFKADTMRVTLGEFLTLTATDMYINTGAADNEELVSFGAIGAEVKIGSLLIGGEGRNFAFLGDGTFVTKAGFGVFLSVGSANGDSFKWPSWLPIRITELGITWDDIQANPADFKLTLSASVTGIQGMAGIEFSGTIEGVVIDVGKLFAGQFPIVDIASIGVTISGDLFGGQINAGLIGGILKVDALGNPIGTFDTTTPVEERIFFVGVEGGFSFCT